jgi:AhpD family alkylhydroperoxidase
MHEIRAKEGVSFDWLSPSKKVKKEATIMDKKVEEMIALGAACGLNCRLCMEFHQQMAIQAGLTQEEMQAAIRVADAVREGAGKKNKEFAKNLFGSGHSPALLPSGQCMLRLRMTKCCSKDIAPKYSNLPAIPTSSQYIA